MAEEEKKAFEAGFAAGVVEATIRIAKGEDEPLPKREWAYDRWVRLGRDTRLYFEDTTWLPRHD